MSTIPSPSSKEEEKLIKEVKKAFALNNDIPHQLPDRIIIGLDTRTPSRKMKP